MALCRAVLINQARGFAGVPSEGHFCSATAYASCNISSARSKSPSRPINVARIRPDSSRCSFSKSIRKEFPHRTLPKQALAFRGAAERPEILGCVSPILRLLGLSADRQWTHLNRSVPRGRNSRSDGDGLVQVIGIHKEIAAQLLLGFREWPVGDHPFAVSHAHRRRHCGRHQLAASQELALTGELVSELPVFPVNSGLVRWRHLSPVGFRVINKQQVFHGLASCRLVERRLRKSTIASQSGCPGRAKKPPSIYGGPHSP